MTDKYVVVSPLGNEYETESPEEYVNFKGQGYEDKKGGRRANTNHTSGTRQSADETDTNASK